jgi:hypothetical protein
MRAVLVGFALLLGAGSAQAAPYLYDMGTEKSRVWEGCTAVTPASAYSEAAGFGWQTAQSNARPMAPPLTWRPWAPTRSGSPPFPQVVRGGAPVASFVPPWQPVQLVRHVVAWHWVQETVVVDPGVATRFFEASWSDRPGGWAAALGALVARAVAQRHGGDALFMPREGRGSTTRLTFGR